MIKQPKKIDLVQGSPEWLEYRRGHIMASDASIIMNDNPYRNLLDLYEDKVHGKSAHLNEAMRRGQEMEPKARKWAEVAFGELFEPCVYEHPFIDRMAASLDGVSKCEEIVIEIKCGIKSHEMALKGEIPDYYKWQMYHQMEVMNVDKIFYISYQSDDDVEVIPFFREDVLIEQLIIAEKHFYENHMMTGAPPNSKPKEHVEDVSLCPDERRKDRIRRLFLNIRQLKSEVEELERMIEEDKKELIDLTLGCSIVLDEFKCTKIEVKGPVEYKRIEALKDVNLDDYRGPSRIQWRIQ